MFWFTNSVETSKLFINNTFPNILCRKAPRIGSPFNIAHFLSGDHNYQMAKTQVDWFRYLAKIWHSHTDTDGWDTQTDTLSHTDTLCIYVWNCCWEVLLNHHLMMQLHLKKKKMRPPTRISRTMQMLSILFSEICIFRKDL